MRLLTRIHKASNTYENENFVKLKWKVCIPQNTEDGDTSVILIRRIEFWFDIELSEGERWSRFFDKFMALPSVQLNAFVVNICSL